MHLLTHLFLHSLHLAHLPKQAPGLGSRIIGRGPPQYASLDSEEQRVFSVPWPLLRLCLCFCLWLGLPSLLATVENPVAAWIDGDAGLGRRSPRGQLRQPRRA